MDQITDQNPVALYRVDQLAGTPDFVLDSPVLSAGDVAKFASTAFADTARREFPIFNKAATWTSYAYFKGAGKSDPLVEARILNAAVTHGIAAEIEKIDNAFSATKSASAPETPHALPKGSVPDYPDFEVYPIKTASQIEDSARQLLNDRQKMPVELFYQAAAAITKAAAVHADILIPDRVKEAGTLRYPDYAHAAKVAEQRAFVVKDPTALAAYADAVKSASANNGLDASDAIATWLKLDREHGVKYARGILDPIDAFYAGPKVEDVEKFASLHVFVKDVAVPAIEITKLNDDTICAHFSKSAAEKVKSIVKQAKSDAVAASVQVSALGDETQKELLRLVVEVA